MCNRLLFAFLAWLIAAQPVLAAVSCSVLTQSSSTTNATNYDTDSVTPTANALILLATVATRNSTVCSDNDVVTVTGNSLTWANINRQCFSSAGTPVQTVELWRTMGASPSTGTINFDFSSTTQLNAAWAVIECTGIDTSGSNGSGAIVQNAINLVEPGTSLTVNLAAFGDAGNATLGVFGVADNVTVTEGSGFTELAEQLVSDGGTDIGLQVEWKTSNDTSVDASFSSIDAGGIAIEIKAAATATDTSGEILWFY